MHNSTLSPPLNYFTCTLAEAADSNTEKTVSSKTVNEFFESQSKHNPKLPAVAFPVPLETTWSSEVFCMKPLV